MRGKGEQSAGEEGDAGPLGEHQAWSGVIDNVLDEGAVDVVAAGSICQAHSGDGRCRGRVDDEIKNMKEAVPFKLNHGEWKSGEKMMKEEKGST